MAQRLRDVSIQGETVGGRSQISPTEGGLLIYSCPTCDRSVSGEVKASLHTVGLCEEQ